MCKSYSYLSIYIYRKKLLLVCLSWVYDVSCLKQNVYWILHRALNVFLVYVFFKLIA